MACFACFVYVIIIALVLLKIYIKLTTGWCKSNVCLVGKTAIVTGANTGIGYETAADFAKRGAKVILACRNPTRGQDAADRIVKATDNRNVVFKQLDLTSLKSVRKFADEINKTEERLDILVNNAGIVDKDRTKTEDGLNQTMQTNHFGHFLLTNLLLNLLKKTPNSRIVNVSSEVAKYAGKLDVNNLNSYPEDSHFAALTIYGRSKLCNILFTIELANRLKGTGVTAYSLHPGVVVTEIGRKSPEIVKLLSNISNLFQKSAIEGAQTTILCAVAKNIESLSGQHFSDCKLVNRYKTAEDAELPDKLWKASEKIVKLN